MRCKVVGIKKSVIPRYELFIHKAPANYSDIYCIYIHIVIWHNKNIHAFSLIIYLTAKWRLHFTFSLRDLHSEL